MKMRVFFPLLVIFPLVGIAQEFAPIGAKWYFPETYAWSPNIGLITAESIGDTTINDLACRVVFKDRGSCLVDGGRNLYFHQSNDSLYHYDITTGEFDLIVVFGAGPGDSWQINESDGGLGDTLTCTVDSISYFNYSADDSLRIQHVTLTSNDFIISGSDTIPIYERTLIIEKIGFSIAILPPKFNSICDGNFESWIRCYMDDTCGLINFTGEACDLTKLDETTGQEQVSIFPNPSKGNITIEFDGTNELQQLEIFSLSGKKLISFTEGSSSIDLSALPSGVYLLRLMTKEGMMIEKILID